MKKIIICTLLLFVVLCIKAQKFDFNNLQAGSISIEAILGLEKESLGKTESIKCHVEFTWYDNSLKIVGKTQNGDTLFEFGKGYDHYFCLDYSDENHLNIVVLKGSDVSIDPDSDGIASIEIYPPLDSIDVYFPEKLSGSPPYDLIRFISKDDNIQQENNMRAYKELRAKMLAKGFLKK